MNSSLLIDKIHDLSSKLGPISIMEFCGGHTHALVKNGLIDLFPKTVRMVHGPGCPVCVLPPNHIQAVIDLLQIDSKLTAVVYGDLMRIPTLGGKSLLDAKNRGLSVKMIYSPLEIISLASQQPEREFIFMAIGFETTAPATAILLKKLKEQNIKNVSILCLHVLTPPAIFAVLKNLPLSLRPQAIIGPGHVSLVTGLSAYPEIVKNFDIPIVISGFEATDLISSVYLALEAIYKQRNDHSPAKLINQFTRALHDTAGLQAKKLLEETFSLRNLFSWRGLGELPESAYCLNHNFAEFDAEKKFIFSYREISEHPHCQCGNILKGLKSPPDCKLFAKTCKPNRPFGSCMVSSEGACHAYYESGVEK